ncbi:phage late control D family protein [Hansschlegelia zhihuaiae]|uniref:Phage late control D family protein n=1 Tax=Hansschlegelia zhihuaiae TaxID=405005 RepID=A0A4Q0MKY5_9HYPH|nr:hypothetical protein [Hansschlegelia zhihuaiae]RXF74125.1 hypothetical protein EK403_07065 [Hansschlegelia zhihuaiae]
MPLLPAYFAVQVAFAPLPPPFIHALREIEVESAVGQASIFRLHFDLSRNAYGDFDALAFDIFRPLLPVTVRLAFGLGVPMTIATGFLHDAGLSASNEPGSSTLEVVGMDALGTIMGHIQQPFIWPNLPDSEIVRAIFAKYATIPVVVPTPPSRTIVDTITTQRDTDAAYLFQLAERNAYELYLQPEPFSGVTMGHFHPRLWPAPPQGVLSIDFGSKTNLTAFSVSNDMLQPRGVVGASVDPRTRAPIPAIAPVSIEPPMGLEPTLNRIIPPPIERPLAGDAANPIEMQMRAFSRASESSRAVTAQGEVDGLKYARPLLPGLPVLVRGAGRQHSGAYYVTSVSHRISRDGWTQSFSASRNAVGLTGAEVFVDPFDAVA